jgi:hypothetical protein
MASPLTVTFAPAAIWNTREALFPLMLSRLAPGPVTVSVALRKQAPFRRG